MLKTSTPISRAEVSEALTKGSRFIAPLWSLENFVAVNSYMGMADMPFDKAMDFLYKSANTNGTLPSSFYQQALKSGFITSKDISAALNNKTNSSATDDIRFIDHLLDYNPEPLAKLPLTYADVASIHSEKKWGRFMIDRVSFWAAAYFDNYLAMWDTSVKGEAIFKAWKQEAEIDYSPEVMGLKGFRKHIATLPDNYLDAVALALDELGITNEMMDFYFNALLMKINGWAGFAARLDWEAGLHDQNNKALQEFLAILVIWDMSVKKLLANEELDQNWQETKNSVLRLIENDEIEENLSSRLILQQAFDLAHERTLIKQLNTQENKVLKQKTPKVQAVFCIDVRSEVLRRNIEAVSDEVETLGFAGFFGFPVEYVPIGHETGRKQCPVLINTTHTVTEHMPDAHGQKKALNRRLRIGHVAKAMKAFKKGAISCFGFVSPLGIYFLPKLLSDSLSLTRPVPHPERTGLSAKEEQNKGVDLTYNTSGINTGISLEDRIKMGHTALKGMSLTDDFASVVLITGHGSTTTNNPHATGLDCGACGGNSGEANAKVAAAILNNPAVREGIKKKGIEIPDATLFVAALHDTTTDTVTLFNAETHFCTPTHKEELKNLRYTLELAGQKTRAERAERMKIKGSDLEAQIMSRSKDWSQVRPEWGLAGCSSFIVAPRHRTADLDLGGSAFLHNYNWQKDENFGILELIMTAPMVVTSWINLQYYASTVDNKVFGSGNKTLHNVVGGVGVMEGFGGDLRVGLPMQSVNDGEKFQHEPLRLKVLIEAPVDEMSKILRRHETIRNLCDNHWIYLYAMNDEGKIAYKYVGDLEWELL